MKRLFITLIGLLIMMGIDVVVPIPHHEGIFWQNLNGGYAVFGLVACLTLILVAKTLGKAGIVTTEDVDD